MSLTLALASGAHAQVVELFKLVPADGGYIDYFGRQGSISGQRALVGAENDGAGSAYLYERQPSGSWLLMVHLALIGTTLHHAFLLLSSGAAVTAQAPLGHPPRPLFVTFVSNAFPVLVVP